MKAKVNVSKAIYYSKQNKSARGHRKGVSVLFLLVTIFAAAILMLTAGCGGGSSGSPAAQDPVDNVLKVGIYDLDLPPLFFLDAEGNLTGFEIDLLEEVAGRLGREMEYVRVTDEYAEALLTGEVDMVWGNVPVMEGEASEGLLLSRPYLKTEQVAVVDRDSGIERKEDLEGKRFVAVRWTAADQMIKDRSLGINYSRASAFRNYLTPFDSMQRDSATVVICDETIAKYMIRELGDGFVILAEALGEVSYAAAFRPDDTRILEKVESALDAIGADGAGEKLSMQWFDKNLYIK